MPPTRFTTLPFRPTLAPMLAKLSDSLPEGEGWLFEPKWDGFRAIVFKEGDDIELQSRDLKPLARYFPELLAALRVNLPERCVVDGEIVIATVREQAREKGECEALDFEALLLRIHPASSRIELLSQQTPASFVAWDLLALDGDDLREVPLELRRARLESALANAKAPVHLTPATKDRALAQDWFTRFEGAGLDGVVSKRLDGTYEPGKRVMVKTKHVRTADCVVAGFRLYKGRTDAVGSLVLGLFDDAGKLHSVGVAASFTMKKREELFELLKPLCERAMDEHPWREWAAEVSPVAASERKPGMTSRWNRGKDLSWQALRIEHVCEVKFDHMQGDRFRHATHFVRWRDDKAPQDCTYAQLEVTPPHELRAIFVEHVVTAS